MAEMSQIEKQTAAVKTAALHWSVIREQDLRERAAALGRIKRLIAKHPNLRVRSKRSSGYGKRYTEYWTIEDNITQKEIRRFSSNTELAEVEAEYRAMPVKTMPINPDVVYARRGWDGWRKFLGSTECCDLCGGDNDCVHVGTHSYTKASPEQIIEAASW